MGRGTNPVKGEIPLLSAILLLAMRLVSSNGRAKVVERLVLAIPMVFEAHKGTYKPWRRLALMFVNPTWFYPAVVSAQLPIEHLESDSCWCDPIIDAMSTGRRLCCIGT
jgi:hypothetical protein